MAALLRKPHLTPRQLFPAVFLSLFPALWWLTSQPTWYTGDLAGKVSLAGYSFFFYCLLTLSILFASYPLWIFFKEGTSGKTQIWYQLLAVILAIVASYSAFFTLPNALQPENQLILHYSDLPARFPDILIEPFDTRNEPIRFTGTDQGIPGLLELHPEDSRWVLSGQTNFRGDAQLVFDPDHAPPATSIEWNGQTLELSDAVQTHLLKGNSNPFSGKSAFLQISLIVLLLARLVSFYLGWLLLLIFAWSSLHLLQTNLTPVNRMPMLNWQLTALLATAVLFVPFPGIHSASPLPTEDRILLAVMMLIGVIALPSLRRKVTVETTPARSFAVIGWATALWSSIALVGNQLLFIPRTTDLLPADSIVRWIAAIIFGFALLAIMISLLEVLANISDPSTRQHHPKRRFAIFFLIIIIPLLIAIVAYNPAISSMDSQGQWWQATEQTPLDDAHSIFHTLTLRVLISISFSPFLIALLQAFLYALLATRLLNRFAEHGVSPKVLGAIALLLSLTPAHFLTVITIWKDVPYMLSLLWLTDILIRLLLFPKPKPFTKWMLLESAICLFFVSQFRLNGVLPGVLTALFLLGYALKFKRLLPAFAVVLYVIMMVVFNGPVKRALEVIPMESQQTVIGLNVINDLLAIEKMGGTLPERAASQLERTLPDREIADFSFFQTDTTWRRSAVPDTIETPSLLSAYLETILRNPLTFLRALMLRLDILYAYRESPFGGFTDSVNWTDADLAGFPRQPTVVKALIDNYLEIVAASPLYPIGWRGGFSLMCLVFGAAFLARTHRLSRLWIALPMAGNVLSLYLATYPAFRYSWPTLLLTGFILLSFLSPEPLSRTATA
jgi:uncharacterized membrane protein YidH (DUF202 family)